MNTVDVIRAWRDAEYADSLTLEQRASLPEHPAGAVEVTEKELNNSIASLWDCTVTAICTPCPPRHCL